MNKGGILNLEDALETGVSGAKRWGKTAASQITGQRNKDTQDIVESLYAQSDQDKKGVKIQNSKDQFENTPEGLEKKKKLQELQQQLHDEVYYDPLVNPKKPQEEERPAERIEQEKKEEMIDLQKKEKEKPPPLVQRTRERVEKYPGASG